MMRKILLLALVSATLPLYGLEEMQFITHLGMDTTTTAPGGAFGILEQVDPLDVQGNVSQLQVCHLSFGELQNSSFFRDQKGTITVQGAESPLISTLNLSDWTVLWSQDEGEYKVGNIQLYRGGILEGKALYATKISFPRYQTDENIYNVLPKTKVHLMGSKVQVDDTLTINVGPAGGSGTYALQVSGVMANGLRYGTGPEDERSYFDSPASSGQAHWRSNNTTNATRWYLVK
ncbi:MAG: hypothetical protein IKP06_05095 [Elusimicrobiaceae bacterium]|nr:hypothetical protein [Elusimicrobiaceae bacterium]